MSHEATFWSETEQYHDLVKAYEAGIEEYHPKSVTGMCSICDRCSWPATTVTYYRHTGGKEW